MRTSTECASERLLIKEGDRAYACELGEENPAEYTVARAGDGTADVVRKRYNEAWGQDEEEKFLVRVEKDLGGEEFFVIGQVRFFAGNMLREEELEEEYTPSSSAGDYGPSNPWDAPGMSVRDFI